MRALPRFLTLPVPALALMLGLSLALPLPGHAGDTAPLKSAVSVENLPKSKHTKAGLYISAAEAGDTIAARDDILLIDVRTPEETMFVGHASAANANIPLRLVDPAHKVNAKKGSYATMANPGFVGGVKALIAQADPSLVVVMCRSGSRSAVAIDALVEAGVDLPLYNMIDGFEGDKNDEGRRVVNGWKNAGLPWTTEISQGFLMGAE